MDETRYIVVEGLIGSGKAALAEKLAGSLSANLVLEENDNIPILKLFLKERRRYAFQTQLSFLASRYKQQRKLPQYDLFHSSIVISDCLFDRDRLFARVNLDDEEFALYDQFFSIMAERAPQPDLVIYLSATTEVLWKRVRASKDEDVWISREYIAELNEAYNSFFFHYNRSPLLVVNTSDVDFVSDDNNYGHFLREVINHKKGVKHYIPFGVSEISLGEKV